MAIASKVKRPRRAPVRSCLGPVADLEAHLPQEWWRKLFNALYVKTDGDIVENIENTRREVEWASSRTSSTPSGSTPRRASRSFWRKRVSATSAITVMRRRCRTATGRSEERRVGKEGRTG